MCHYPRHNFSAWENSAYSRSECGRFRRNIPAWEKKGCARSRLGRACEKGRAVYLRERRRPSRPGRAALSQGGTMRRYEPFLMPARPRFSQARTMRQGRGATSLLGRVERVRAANSDDSGATSRLGRKAGAQRPGSGETARRSDPSTCANVGARPCLKKRFSPKAGPCAEKGPILSSRGRTSPKAGRCVTPLAQLLGLGEFGGFEQRMRAILAQRLDFGEMRARKIAAREYRREGPSRLPAET